MTRFTSSEKTEFPRRNLKMLNEKYRLRSFELKNRFALAPMTTYSSSEDGYITDEEMQFIESRARDGYGMILSAANYVHPWGKAFTGQWRGDIDEAIERNFVPFAQICKRYGAASVLQIHHGGRMGKAALSGRLLSASAVPAVRPGAETPEEMTREEVLETAASFGAATRRVRLAGFDGIEIHGANTYLLQQFVSPHSNRREDEYGKDKFLFAKQVIQEVLAERGEMFVGYRLSPEEIETPGIRIEQTLRFVDVLCNLDIDYLHLSTRDFRMKSAMDGIDEPIVQTVLRQIDGRKPLMIVGGIRTKSDLDEAARTGAEFVAIGRSALTDPNWLTKINAGEEPIHKLPRKNIHERTLIPNKLVEKLIGIPDWVEREEADSAEIEN